MKQSAGLLVYKWEGQDVRVLLVHPGGPFWAKKDAGAWSIPKGEFQEGEEPVAAAVREFAEELGKPAPTGELVELGSAKQPSGKVVYAWACEADFDVANIKSNVFEMEWPPKSGKQQEFPEVDRAAWVTLGVARQKLVKGQVPFLEMLAEKLTASMGEPAETSGQTSLF
jgi:predicted NUDIX family NTP pyrophosphohydrolase